MPGASPTPPSLMLMSAGLFMSHFFSLLCLTTSSQLFLPFHKFVFPKAPSALQLGSAVSFGESSAETAGIGSGQDETTPGLFSQMPPMQLSLLPTTKTLLCKSNIILLIEDFFFLILL